MAPLPPCLPLSEYAWRRLSGGGGAAAVGGAAVGGGSTAAAARLIIRGDNRTLKYFAGQLRAAERAAAQGRRFVWELRSDLTRWARFYRERVQAPRVAAGCRGTPAVTCLRNCHSQEGMRGGHWADAPDESGAKCVRGMRGHSSLALELRGAFFAAEGLAAHGYHDLHLRNHLSNGCDDAKAPRVGAHAARLFRDGKPLVIHSNNGAPML